MMTFPVIYNDGCDRFVWCVDDVGVIRVWPLASFAGSDPGATLAQWGWRLATEHEVLEYLPTLRRAT
jgi:hypothetical protein